MKKDKRNKGKGQKGFTLIELLVVVGILAALAAILVPNVARFVGTGQEEGSEAETDSVQAAMDAAIADLGLTSVVDQSLSSITDFGDTGGGDIGVYPAGHPEAGTTIYLYSDYLRFQDAHYGPYHWDNTGLLKSDWTP